MTVKQNLQVVKPRARQYIAGGQPYWAVYGNGHTQTGLTLDVAYQRWVEEYIHRALYGNPRPVRTASS